MEVSNIRFDDSVRREILDLFGKSIDKEGFVVEKDNLEYRVPTQDGEEILFEDWGGVKKGSETFIKKDLFSLIKLAKEMR